MRLARMPLSRRAILASASALIASGVTSAVVDGIRAPSLRPSAVPGALGRAEFVPNSRVDPRSYLARGETWTTVACIRPAFQAALDEVHRRVVADPKAVVELVIPPGVGRLTTRSPIAPVNRSSRKSPKGIYDLRIGFGLRTNIQGKIVVRGAGGQVRASVIRLSNEARNLFWVDTDTGVDWRDTGQREASGAVVERPAKPMVLRNVLFQGFGVDDNDSGGNTHLVCGSTPSDKTPQRYLSVQNVHAVDIDAWCSRRVSDEADQNKRNKAAFGFVARHFSAYEANGGPGKGTVAGHAWRNWDLRTVDGRAAAHKAGWTWMHAMSFEKVRATDTSRGIIVIGEAHSTYSHWVDDITLTSCEHRQARPYTEGSVPQTSFFIGGSCQGGTASVLSCTSVNVGDDAVEIGGMQNSVIRGLTCINACLAGVYYMYSQPPLDWAGTKAVIEDSTFLVDASAIQPKQSSYVRAVPVDAKFTDDAAALALGELQITRCTTSIDGAPPIGSGLATGQIDKLLRKERYGWFLTGPVAKATYSACSAKLANVVLAKKSASKAYGITMWHAQQKIPAGLGIAPSVLIADCTASVTGISTNGAVADLVAHAVHSTGSSDTTRFRVDVVRCGKVLSGADLARIGWLAPSFTSARSSKHSIQSISGTMSGTTAKARRGVAMFDDQRVDTSRVTGVAYSGWGAPKAVDSSSGPSNGSRLRTA
jgi:hypothetical protein